VVLSTDITCTGDRSREAINFSLRFVSCPVWCAGLIIWWIIVPLKVLIEIILCSREEYL